jgi:hypothetical protein
MTSAGDVPISEIVGCLSGILWVLELLCVPLDAIMTVLTMAVKGMFDYSIRTQYQRNV